MMTKEQHDHILIVCGLLVMWGISPEILGKIFQYLETRTGFSWNKEDASCHTAQKSAQFECEALPSQSLGAFGFIITKCHPEIRIRIDDDDRFHVTPRFHYTHPGGGTNGHQFPFDLIGDVKTGTFFEQAVGRL